MPTEAGPAAGQGPGMRPGGDRIAGGGDERHSGENTDGAAGTIPTEPVGWRAYGRQGVLLLPAGRPGPRHHRAHLQARRCPPGREVRGAEGGPLSGRLWSRGEPPGTVSPEGVSVAPGFSPEASLGLPGQTDN